MGLYCSGNEVSGQCLVDLGVNGALFLGVSGAVAGVGARREAQRTVVSEELKWALHFTTLGAPRWWTTPGMPLDRM